ncbi:MAG: InlB B-repeat-containing protein, partial [Coriobacteriia bacterium]|nr:InlB B-repeat-containing protein [Coriobacteriia bacterium]
MSQKQRTSVVGRAVRLALALLLAITLFPATSLNAFADELDTVEIEAVGQELGAETDELEAEASQSAITIEPSLPEALASVDDEPVDIEQSAQEVPAPHTLEAMGVTVNNIDIVPLSTSAEIVIEARESGQVTIANKWTTDIIVTQDGLPGLPVNSGSLTTLPVTQGDRISVTEENPDATFRQWRDWIYPFVSGVECAIVSMPAMSSFTVNSAGTIAGNNFFKNFNSSGPLISNGYGSLTSLPAGSFDTSNITTTGNSFFNSFNMSGSLTSLPAGSFNTSNITTTGDYFFQNFNAWGSLTSLPAGSFGTSRITTTENNFFTRFNNSGRLTSLPTGSFNTSNITTTGNAFFNDFNASGSLTSLPAGSFNTSNITTTGNAFFNGFNASGSLTSLPTGSFNTSNITTTGNAFFWSFNNRGRLTSLPTGSFNTSGITTGEFGFFRSFNYGGSLTSLPAGSFDTSGITTAGEDFFFVFNYGGSLTSLPASFRLPQSLSSVGAQYCGSMFADSALTKGNQSIPLYFAVASSETFSGTNIAPVNPGAGVTVWVNGGGTIPNRNVTFNLNGGSASWGTGNRTISVQQGALIPAQTATRTGYTLAGWNEGTTRWNFASHTVPARNITLVAQWKPNTNTAYKVEHYKVSSTGKVTLAATQNLKGTTAAKVT